MENLGLNGDEVGLLVIDSLLRLLKVALAFLDGELCLGVLLACLAQVVVTLGLIRQLCLRNGQLTTLFWRSCNCSVASST